MMIKLAALCLLINCTSALLIFHHHGNISKDVLEYEKKVLETLKNRRNLTFEIHSTNSIVRSPSKNQSLLNTKAAVGVIAASIDDQIHTRIAPITRTFSPTPPIELASIERINSTFKRVFPFPRSNYYDRGLNKAAKYAINDILSSLHLETSTQSFIAKDYEGRNIFGILPGKYRNTKDDKILLIGAHYDTTSQGQGTDDNASGSVGLIEIARLATKYVEKNGKLNHTLYFAFFDLEEQGLLGSQAFVSNYFIENELLDKPTKFLGAYIMDMILYYDPRNGTQTWEPDFVGSSNETTSKVDALGGKGDFISAWFRRGHEDKLYKHLEDRWNELPAAKKFKIYPLRVSYSHPPTEEEQREYSSFTRSDHASFWLHSPVHSKKKQDIVFKDNLPALVLNDLGPWRGNQVDCYHQKCDNFDFIKDPESLAFMKQVVDSVFKAAITYPTNN